MLEIAYTMHRGKISSQQQDCILVNGAIHQDQSLPIKTLNLTTNEMLLAVADGVYSSPMAQCASRAVLEELVKVVQKHPERLQNRLITNWYLRQVQQRLADRLASQQSTYGSSSTIVVARICENQAAILNVGDSRAYQVDAAGQWQRLSKDHTVLQGLIDRGQASPDQEYASIYRMLEYVMCADYESDDFAIHRVIVTLKPGDTLVLCSDGIHDEIGDERMWTLFDPRLDTAAQTKIWRDAVWRHGAGDNLSLIVAKVASDP